MKLKQLMLDSLIINMDIITKYRKIIEVSKELLLLEQQELMPFEKFKKKVICQKFSDGFYKCYFGNLGENMISFRTDEKNKVRAIKDFYEILYTTLIMRSYFAVNYNWLSVCQKYSINW